MKVRYNKEKNRKRTLVTRFFFYFDAGIGSFIPASNVPKGHLGKGVSQNKKFPHHIVQTFAIGNYMLRNPYILQQPLDGAMRQWRM